MISEIIKEYARLYKGLIREKKLIRPTSLGYSGSASADVVHEFFRKINLENHKSFLDLGSGDGKIVLVASLFTKATGIEIDEELIDIANKAKKKLGIDNADFLYGDFLEMDLSDYEILFINPDQPLYEIEKKLRKEMSEKQKLIVFGGLYRPLNMNLEKSYTLKGVWFGIYSNNQL